jgi:prepilin-type N-terminal cleavage/methylation domain-containing protein
MPSGCRQRGFTLLEVLIVLLILGMLAAMVVPAMGILDDRERERITRERMEIIRRAIVGPSDRFDRNGRRIIGGYVGDMGAWPDLWEARAEIKPNFSGTGWDNPSSLPPGLGQGPDYTVDPDKVFFRPSGRFEKNNWRWYRPYRKLYDDPAGNDHIGGPETENEGQPRGLWTRYPEDLPFDLPGHPAPGEELGPGWMGPYIMPPSDEKPSDSDHWALKDNEYEALEPAWHTSGPHADHETWEDGDNSPTTGELGEHFDEKEAFRLLQADGRLADGWGQAFRFFITEDPDYPGGTIFWILSEGSDGEGTYPAKGTCTGHSWSVDPADTMGLNYDPSAEQNRDNLVMKLFSRDWQTIFNEENLNKEEQTRETVAGIRAALLGEAPTGANTGFSGDLCDWPHLFRWEDNGTPGDPSDDYWDDEDGSDMYTKGQPRGLWTDKPGRSGGGDDLPPSHWGLGWRHAYLGRPEGSGAENRLRDGWEREILFFRDESNDAVLILSRGLDGRFDFGAVNAEQTEPENFTEAVDVTAYDPLLSVNEDNVFLVVQGGDRQPGFFRLLRFVVLDAKVADPAEGTTKACFFRDNGTPIPGVDLLAASVLTDEDGDTLWDDWAVGDGTPADPAFNYDDTTAEQVPTGARYLVFWNDADEDDVIDGGENHFPLIFNVLAVPGSGQHSPVVVHTADFRTAP